MRKLVVALVLLLVPTTVFAQVVVNPTKAQFTASVDHNVTENETALVTNYELRIFQADGNTFVRALNLNKPTPDAANTIIVTITTVTTSLPLGDYVARVAVRGPGGETVSELSNPFQVSARPPIAPTKLLITK